MRRAIEAELEVEDDAMATPATAVRLGWSDTLWHEEEEDEWRAARARAHLACADEPHAPLRRARRGRSLVWRAARAVGARGEWWAEHRNLLTLLDDELRGRSAAAARDGGADDAGTAGCVNCSRLRRSSRRSTSTFGMDAVGAGADDGRPV
jgi:hypothetical protein